VACTRTAFSFIFLTIKHTEEIKTLERKLTQNVSLGKFPHTLLSGLNSYLANKSASVVNWERSCHWTQDLQVQTRPNTMDLKAIKIRSATSFGGKVKHSIQCRKILRHVKKSLRI
jgi:hypothetical protein